MKIVTGKCREQGSGRCGLRTANYELRTASPFAIPLARSDPLPPLVVGDQRDSNDDDSENGEEKHNQWTVDSELRTVNCLYLPTTITVNVPGSAGGRGWGLSAVAAGAGPKSAVIR
jgi:hypothetical protein